MKRAQSLLPFLPNCVAQHVSGFAGIKILGVSHARLFLPQNQHGNLLNAAKRMEWIFNCPLHTKHECSLALSNTKDLIIKQMQVVATKLIADIGAPELSWRDEISNDIADISAAFDHLIHVTFLFSFAPNTFNHLLNNYACFAAILWQHGDLRQLICKVPLFLNSYSKRVSEFISNTRDAGFLTSKYREMGKYFSDYNKQAKAANPNTTPNLKSLKTEVSCAMFGKLNKKPEIYLSDKYLPNRWRINNINIAVFRLSTSDVYDIIIRLCKIVVLSRNSIDIAAGKCKTFLDTICTNIRLKVLGERDFNNFLTLFSSFDYDSHILNHPRGIRLDKKDIKNVSLRTSLFNTICDNLSNNKNNAVDLALFACHKDTPIVIDAIAKGVDDNFPYIRLSIEQLKERVKTLTDDKVNADIFLNKVDIEEAKTYFICYFIVLCLARIGRSGVPTPWIEDNLFHRILWNEPLRVPIGHKILSADTAEEYKWFKPFLASITLMF